MPEGAIYVGRWTPFANLWKPGRPGSVILLGPDERAGVEFNVSGDCSAEWAVATFRAWLTDGAAVWPKGFNHHGHATWAPKIEARRQRLLAALPSLRGRELACWCPPGCPCHADVLMELVNR
jgi:hypothetical protein